MWSRFLILAVFALTAMAGSPDRASAGYQFKFADSTGAYVPGNSFGLSYPSTLTIQVYLVATGPEAATLSAEGLRSFGVRVNYNGTVADVLTTGAIASPTAAFTGTDVKGVGAGNVASDYARLNDTTPIAGPYAASSVDVNGDQRVLLGAFTFSGISNGTTTAITVDPFPTITNTSLGTSGTAIDALIANSSATITVTNVPEPGSLILTGILATGIIGAGISRARRRSAMMMA